MLRNRSKKNTTFRLNSITTAFIVVVMLICFSSCFGKKKDLGDAVIERDSLPQMRTFGVTTFVSDSGVTRYRVDTEDWAIYDRKNPPNWAFESGVYLEKFDTLFQVDASIKADTAYFYNKQNLWKLIGNVHIQNIKGETFDTELLFWNTQTEKVYSDKFITINQIDRIISGYGFESDQNMTNYRIFNMEGIFYVDEQENPAAARDSIPPVTAAPDDSIN